MPRQIKNPVDLQKLLDDTVQAIKPGFSGTEWLKLTAVERVGDGPNWTVQHQESKSAFTDAVDSAVAKLQELYDLEE